MKTKYVKIKTRQKKELLNSAVKNFDLNSLSLGIILVKKKSEPTFERHEYTQHQKYLALLLQIARKEGKKKVRLVVRKETERENRDGEKVFIVR